MQGIRHLVFLRTYQRNKLIGFGQDTYHQLVFHDTMRRPAGYLLFTVLV